ncbi:MAG: LPS-assembly protein LptD, partial [Candidatus Omnitrophica bacterium]|nr:LPS-assembly protein LptD [Candidatus Omnitrophota bacterium]
KGNVNIKSEDSELSCQEAIYDSNTNIAHIKGDVKIKKGNSIIYGQDVVYNFNTLNAEMVDLKLIDPPIYGKAKEGNKIVDEKYLFKKGYVTTCDLEVPHYRLTAKTITVYPEDRVVAKGMVLKVGNTPIFYIPSFVQSLKDDAFKVELIPGKDSDWGLFLLSRWRYNLNSENRGKVHLDVYEDRGYGFGITHVMESEKFGDALINLYTISDTLYKLDSREKLGGLRSTSDHRILEDDRYKIQIAHQWDPTDKLSITNEFNKFSDEYFMKDFFEKEYDVSPNTKSYNLMQYSLSASSLSLRTQVRANSFFTETEYLPQLEYNFFKQNLGNTNFYFESDSSTGILKKGVKYTREYSKAFRAYSHNTLSYITKIKWLNINPYVGSYSAFYSRNKFYDYNVFRETPELGATMNVKMYKYFNDIGWSVFGEKIDQMRHILRPEIKYEYIHDPTVSDNNLVEFDDDDTLARKDLITFVLENKLQARNVERTWDFIYFSPSVTYTVNPEGSFSRFNTISGDFEIYPKDGFSLTSNASYDVQTRRVRSFNVDFTITGKEKVIELGEEVEKEKYSISYGHRYSRQNSTQGTIDFNYQLTPKLKFRSYARCEYNTGDFQTQQYSIRADLHCWWLDLGLDVSRPEVGGKNLGFWFVFTLKDFPDISAGFDQTFKGAKASYSGE